MNKLPLGLKLSLLGTENENVAQRVGYSWHIDAKWAADRALIDAKKKASAGEKTEKVEFGFLKYYPVELLASSLMELSSTSKSQMAKDGISLRDNGLADIWQYLRAFAETTNLEIMKDSGIVQKLIDGGYKPQYVGVPEAEFTEFAKTYRAPPGFFGRLFGKKTEDANTTGGRKSRKQNKSRKQGKSRKQRKSRK
jgi:hypothetical protein